jgi:hypothetical protein
MAEISGVYSLIDRLHTSGSITEYEANSIKIIWQESRHLRDEDFACWQRTIIISLGLVHGRDRGRELLITVRHF